MTATTCRPTLPVTTVADLLDQAATYLGDNGWTPSGYYDTHDGCTRKCWVHRTHLYPASSLGAIRAALVGRAAFYLDHLTPDALHLYTTAVEWFNSYLLTVGAARRHASLFDWETCPNRNGLQVIAALHAAATAHRLHTRRAAA